MTGPLSDPELRTRWTTVLAALRHAEPEPYQLGDHVFGIPPSAQVYLTLPYLDAVDAACPGSIGLTIDDREGHETAAAIYAERKGPYRIIRVPPFTSYTAIATKDPGKALCALLPGLVADSHAFRLHFPPDFVPSLSSGTFPVAKTGELFTYYAPVAPADAIRTFWSENPTRVFRRERDAFHVEEEASAARALADLVTASYARHNRKPELSVEAITRLVSRAVSGGIARLFVCRDESGEARAAAAFLIQDQAAWYWSAGSHPGPAMTVLIGTVLPRLHDLGVKSFDFVGANTPSIAEFKRRFGSARRGYHYVAAVRRPDLRAMLAIRSALSGMRRG